VHLCDVVFGIIFGVSAFFNQRVDKHISALPDSVSSRSAELVLTFLLDELVVDQFLLLLHPVVNLDLVLLVSAPRVVHAHDSVFLIPFEFTSLQEFRLVVSVSEEKSHGSALLSLTLAVCSVLDHRSHRSDTGA